MKTLITTPRLNIRELETIDRQSILRFANDERINRYLGFGELNTESGVESYIAGAIEAAAASPRHSFKLAMALSGSDELAGSCWLDIEDPHSKNASIGYFVDSAHWGNGYATEMLEALIRFGFDDLALHRLYANCDEGNRASRKVLEKAGMQQEALLREHCLRDYGWTNVCLYGILR